MRSMSSSPVSRFGNLTPLARKVAIWREHRRRTPDRSSGPASRARAPPWPPRRRRPARWRRRRWSASGCSSRARSAAGASSTARGRECSRAPDPSASFAAGSTSSTRRDDRTRCTGHRRARRARRRDRACPPTRPTRSRCEYSSCVLQRRWKKIDRSVELIPTRLSLCQRDSVRIRQINSRNRAMPRHRCRWRRPRIS